MYKDDGILMSCAKLWAIKSYAVKAKVGAVLADEGRIVATGYNGTVSGHANICEEEIECKACKGLGEIKNISYIHLFDKCTVCNGVGYKLKTTDFVVHAEQNVISFCAKQGIPTDGLTMYITLSPCATCAKLMVQCGIKRVVYLNEYKDKSGIKFLKDCGVQVEKYNKEII